MYLFALLTKPNYVQIVDGAKRKQNNLYKITSRINTITNKLKKNELNLSNSNNEIEKKINVVVQKLSIDRETISKYIEVPESLTLHQCISTELSEYNVLTDRKCAIPGSESNEVKHRFLTNIVNEVNRRNTIV
ncbi:unnamed protein product [Schistosoma spindalis]|nr:unnamed protein product [Schistosoma spindale]